MARFSRPWKTLKQDLLRHPEVRKTYEKLGPEFQLARAIIALRAAKGLTQEEMAERAKIKRPMLSRLEGAKDLPTLPTLARLAAAIGARVEVRFVDRKNRELGRVPPIRVRHKSATAPRELVR